MDEDNELGAYLRRLRESVAPADVGLPEGDRRRRTPGLRRSEWATLAGVSVEYVTRLEQGRDRNPSGQVLTALADALDLPPDQRIHLRNLAKVSGGDATLCTATEPPPRSVRPTMRALLDQLEPAPALLLNPLGDVLAWTAGYEQVAGPIGLLDGEVPNLARFVFTDPRARTAYPEWGRVADEHAARLRVARATVEQAAVAALLEDLAATAGAPFTERLAAPPNPPSSAGTERLVHPEVGELRLDWETLHTPDTEQQLVVYLPSDTATTDALDLLTGRHPGALRAVGD